MKKAYSILIALLMLVVGTFSLQAQCAYNNTLYVPLAAPSTIGASIGTGDCIFPGEFYRVTGMQAGSTYRISTCNTTDVADTRVTVYASGGAGGALVFNDDFCGLLSRVDFTPATTGNYDVLIDQTGPGNTCVSIEECVEMTITLIGTSGSTDYCTPLYSVGTSNGDFINGVSLQSINNQNSGSVSGPSYSDFTNLSTALSASTGYTLSVRNNPDFQEIVAAWIDYNQDFEFSEDELLGQQSVNANGTALINFTTPANPLAGTTRMRVRMVFSVPTSGGTVSPCDITSLGETEDYSITFSTNNPPSPPGALSFGTNCGIGTDIQDNACPNNTFASVTVGGLSSLGSNHSLSSVELIIEHAMAADLDLYLEAPNGSIVELSTDNGGSGANYGIYTIGNCTQTALFSMTASTPISGSAAPFVGSYIPEGDLNDFNTAGLNPNGIWRLRACDDFAGDLGTIQYFKLNFEFNETEVPSCANSYGVSDGASNVALDQQLTWTAGTGNPTTYDVYFGTDSGNLVLVSDNQSGTSFDPGALTAATTYYYQIVPTNNVGDATGCPVNSFTTVDQGSPSVLMGNDVVTICDANFYDAGGLNGNYENNEAFSLTLLPATANSAIQVSFSSFELDELDFLIAIDGTTEFDPVIGIYSGTSIPETITATNPNGAISFLFISDDIVNLAGWEGTISCVPLTSIPACVSVSSPADLSTNVAITADLTWTEGAGLPTSYDIFFGVTSTPSLVASGVTGNSYDLPVLGNEGTYYYQIVPANGSGSAEGCPVISFTTEAAQSNIVLMQDGEVTTCDGLFYDSGSLLNDYSTDENLTLTLIPATANSVIEVAFTSFSSEESFDSLYVYSGTGTGGVLLGALSGENLNPITFTSLAVEGSMTFVFVSDFQVSLAGWEATISCVAPLVVPTCATNFVPANGSTDVTSPVILSWESTDASVTSYDVYLNVTGETSTLVAEGITETFFQTAVLTGGTSYSWQVVPANIVGSAENCSVNEFTTLVEGSAPTCVINESPASDAVDVAVDAQITWSAGSGDAPDSYDVYFGTDAQNLTLVSADQAGTSFNPGTLNFETQYFWQVVPSNAFGTAVDCPVYAFTTVAEVVVSDIIMQNGSISACSGNFYDSGNIDNNYSNDESFVLTITPDQTGNVLQVIFNEFDIEEDFEFLTIYDGNSTSASVIGTFTGLVSPGTIVSTATDGSLTFEFTSDASLNEAGWEAAVSCIDPNDAPLCASNLSPADGAVDVTFIPSLSWTNGGGVVVGYDVYFGTDAQNLALVSEGQTETSFAVGSLETSTTYFWQVVPVGISASAQDCQVVSFTTEADAAIIMQNASITACSANFYDSGNINNEYANDENFVLTITPDQSGNVLQVIFSAFDIEEDFEFLTIYDGNSTSAPVIGTYTGLVSPGTIASTATDGSLTFEFTSDAFVTEAGWEAAVSCINPNEAPSCATNYSPADGSTEVAVAPTLTWSNGGGVVLGYDVYFGTDPGSLTLVSSQQTETTFIPGALDLNTTYYWQVIPVGASAAAQDCQVISFTTQSVASIIMQNGAITICDANFYDSGDIDANYGVDEAFELTLTPETAGQVLEVIFTSFSTENNFDFLDIYDGNSTAAPLIGSFTGLVSPGTVVSTATDGSLTFVFTSDVSVTRFGWEASIGCIDPNAAPNCVENQFPADGATDVSLGALALSWVSGGGNASGYDVYFGTDAQNLVQVSQNQTETTFPLADLELSTTYFWQVVALNENGAAIDCPVLSFTTSSTLDIVMQNGAISTCDANFYDSGASTGDYQIDENYVLTISPDQPDNVIQVVFNSFDVENTWDLLTIYDGNSTAAPQIGVFTGATVPTTVVSSSVDGSLTFEFTSDGSVVGAGWDATVSCVSVAGVPECASILSPADLAVDVEFNTLLTWNNGGGIVTGYDVYFGTDPGSLVLVSPAQVGTSFNPGALELNTTYYWQVVPMNENGSASDCAVNSFTTTDEVNVNIFNGEVTLCAGNLFDSGGPDANYSTVESNTLTVYPSTPGAFVQADFVSLDIESGFDFLDIYDGNSATGTPIVSLTGTATPTTIISSAADGSLTFDFTSDFIVTAAGFEITLSCFTPTEAPSCSENYFPVDGELAAALNTSLSWDGVGFPSGYNVLLGTDPGNLVEVATGITASTYTPVGLLPNTQYFWQIVPFNDFGSVTDCAVLTFTTSATEVINMFTGEATTCAAEFYDSQGPDANYLIEEEHTLTVFPGTVDNVLRVTFDSFGSENNFDFLTIFSGPTATGTPLATLTGPQVGPLAFTSSSPDGALTFVWTSDVSITGAGWAGNFECVSTTEIPGCVTNVSPVDGSIDVSPTLATLSWGLGSGIAFGYDVYFGTDPDAMALISPAQAETFLNPGQLDLNTTYYWQVVPSNASGEATGCPVNSFTTSGSIDIIQSNNTVTTCSANFYDSGNIGGTYLNDENSVLTIIPDQPGNSIQVTFNLFNLENNFDFLTIYNGNSTAAPVIGTFTGNLPGQAIPTAPITSSAVDGSLTFEFTSDVSLTRAGWEAIVECIDATQAPSCVNITTGPADGATDICVNEAVLTWSQGSGAPATAFDVYFDFGGGLILVSDDQTALTFDPGVLIANTTYSYQVVPSNANGEAVDCPVNTFTTGTCLNYCDAGAVNCDEFIANVEMGDINNPTDCTAGGYNDYTDQSTNVYIGTATPIVVTNGTSEWVQDQCGIWIDWNQDGDFADANETISVTGTPGTGPYTAQIIAPTGASLGATTMRVRITFTGVVDPCGIATFGEVEDYTIIVNEALACPFPNNILTSETTTTSTVVTWDAVTDVVEYQIRYRLETEDVSVPTWSTPLIVPAPLTFTFLENLEICGNYILQIASVCEVGATDITFSSNVFFGTRCIECSPEYVLEGEDCGTDVNGGCNSTPAAFGAINCGETICGTSFMDGSTRDTDWFSFDVTEAGVFQMEVLAEFDGTVLFTDASDCANIIIPSQANFSAGEPFILASSLNPGTYTVILIPVFEQPIFGCSDFNAYTLTLSSGTTQIGPVANICESTAPFNLFAIPAGGTWSGNGIVDAVAGTFDPASVGVGSYTVTYTPAGAGCSVADSITIDVEQAPEADFVGLAATYCPGAEDVVLTGIPAGGTFSISPSVAGAIVGNVFIPSLCAPGSYDITYVVSLGSGACAGTLTQTVEILDSPVASIDALPSAVCSQDDVITLSGTPAGGVFSGAGVSGNSFDPSMAGTGAVSITYTVSDAGFVCPAIVTSTIQVNPAPVVTLSGVSGDYCLNSSIVNLVGTPALGSFIVDGVESTNGTFDPAAAGIGSHVVRYEFDNGTCVGFDEVIVNVVDNISISFVGTPTEVCSEDDPFLIQTSPAGAVLSGLGVFGNTFSPKVAGVGSHTITATYSNGNCTAVATHTIVVNATPAASFTYNVNGATVAFNNSSLNATSYSWDFGDGSTSTSINPTHTYATNGSYVITLTASNPDCGNSVFTATLELSVGIGSIEGVDMIQLYPNPTGGLVNLAFNSLNQQSFEVRITDATGRLIQVDAVSNYVGKFNKQYDLSDKAKGVYFFTITSDKGAINFRVVRD